MDSATDVRFFLSSGRKEGTVAATVKSKIRTQRKRKPKQLATVNECCTGCGGSPVCQDRCPVENCLTLVPDEENAPEFGRMTVAPLLCIGCKSCISKGPDGTHLEGCPWDAIDMIALPDFEAEHGELPY